MQQKKIHMNLNLHSKDKTISKRRSKSSCDTSSEKSLLFAEMKITSCDEIKRLFPDFMNFCFSTIQYYTAPNLREKCLTAINLFTRITLVMKDGELLSELIQEDTLKVLLICYQHCGLKETKVESIINTVLSVWIKQGTTHNLKDFLSALWTITNKHIEEHLIGRALILLLKVIRKIQKYNSKIKAKIKESIEDKSLYDLVKQKKVMISLHL